MQLNTFIRFNVLWSLFNHSYSITKVWDSAGPYVTEYEWKLYHFLIVALFFFWLINVENNISKDWILIFYFHIMLFYVFVFVLRFALSVTFFSFSFRFFLFKFHVPVIAVKVILAMVMLKTIGVNILPQKY